jgi:hypothetical protein
VNETGSAAKVAVAAIMRSASLATLAPVLFEVNIEASFGYCVFGFAAQS